MAHNTQANNGDSASQSNAKILSARQAALERLCARDTNIFPASMREDPDWEVKSSLFYDLMSGKRVIPSAGEPNTVPSFNLLNNLPPGFLYVSVMQSLPAHHHEFLANVPIGVGVIMGCAGTGKTHLAALTTVCLCYNLKNIADIVSREHDNLVTPVNLPRLMVVRGYSIELEVQACFNMLQRRDVGFHNGEPWQFHQSLCDWTLRVLGCASAPALDHRDCPRLLRFSAALRSLLDTESPEDELHQFTHLTKIARGLVPWDSYLHDPNSGHTEHSIRYDLTRLMALVTRCADVVLTTPLVSSQGPYLDFNNRIARAVVIDEASAMDREDALIVLGNCLRPTFLVGDKDQMRPTVVQVPGRQNEAAPVSILSVFGAIQWPYLELSIQYRMATGMLDTALNTVYPMSVQHRYGPRSHLSMFQVGAQVRRYLKREQGIKSPATRWAPLFIQCDDCPCHIDEATGAVTNPRAVNVMADYLRSMMTRAQISPDKITVLTPFASNLRVIDTRFRDDTLLSGIQRHTYEGFQGREAEIIVLSLCVSEETGPLDTADPGRLAFALSRHKSTLLVFGDQNTVSATTDQRLEYRENEEGSNKTLVHHAAMGRVFAEFCKNWHVINIAGDLEDTVVEETEEANDQPDGWYMGPLGLGAIALYCYGVYQTF